MFLWFLAFIHVSALSKNHALFSFSQGLMNRVSIFIHVLQGFVSLAKKRNSKPKKKLLFPECVARVPVSLGGLGVRLCSPSFAFATATVRNRRQPSATACGSPVRLSTVASASGVVQKACQVDCLSPQLYWCLQRRCLCE